MTDGAEQLVRWGRVLRLTTIGRLSGRAAVATIGFVEEPGGSLLVAAGWPGTHWGLNLLANPACEVTIADRTRPCRAEPLAGDDAAGAVRELILKYGTPSEGLGSGPAFRLRPERGSAFRPRPVAGQSDAAHGARGEFDDAARQG